MDKDAVMYSNSSSYRNGLDEVSKKRYDDKLSLIGGFDPYHKDKVKWSSDTDILPAVTYPDICFYLIYTPSAYTKDDLKAWKSMDAVNQLCFGWVRERAALVHGEHIVVTAKVMHSQRMREKPLRPWVIAKPDGVIVVAHCDCMAGLGEACTHIAALLFSISSTVQVRDSKTVTEKGAYWMLPTAVKSIQYKEISDINFVSVKTAKKRLDGKLEAVCSGNVPPPATPGRTVSVPKANESDLMSFCEELSKLKSKPALLSVVEPYADKFVPKAILKNYPADLNTLRDNEWVGKDYTELLKHCETIKVECSSEQAENVDLDTRAQSKSGSWYRFRAGRVTASNAKSVCTTNIITNPSQSLIKKVCYPLTTKFKSTATQWGIEKESVAREAFMDTVKCCHENSHVDDSGFVISQEHPFLGASPDGMFSCDCCGLACVEIKCPFKLRKEVISADNCEYLYEKDGELKLKSNHPYYYQVQTQLGVTKRDICYFVVWTEESIHVETIQFDQEVWEEIFLKSKAFFRRVILPELVGKHFTSSSVMKGVKRPALQAVENTLKSDNANSPSHKVQQPVVKDKNSDEERFCLCDQVEFGHMIACDNIECPIEWFHWGCVNVENKPRGKWYCPDCRKLPAFKRKRVTKKK